MMTMDRRSSTNGRRDPGAASCSWRPGRRSKSWEDGPTARINAAADADKQKIASAKARIKDQMRILWQGFGPAIFLPCCATPDPARLGHAAGAACRAMISEPSYISLVIECDARPPSAPLEAGQTRADHAHRPRSRRQRSRPRRAWSTTACVQIGDRRRAGVGAGDDLAALVLAADAPRQHREQHHPPDQKKDGHRVVIGMLAL